MITSMRQGQVRTLELYYRPIALNESQDDCLLIFEEAEQKSHASISSIAVLPFLYNKPPILSM